MPKILIASTVLQRLAQLQRGLAALGYEAHTAASSAEVWASVIASPPDALIVDASAPSADLDPWLLCAELTVVLNQPVIALTRPGRNHDRLRALRSGVLQCLTIPISAKEISACLGMVLNHSELVLVTSPEHPSEDYVDFRLHIDLANRRVLREGRSVVLTTKEFELLQCLLREDGNVVPVKKLSQALWSYGSEEARCNRLKTYISRLRKKIEADPSEPQYIVSQHGFGYSFVRQASELN